MFGYCSEHIFLFSLHRAESVDGPRPLSCSPSKLCKAPGHTDNSTTATEVSRPEERKMKPYSRRLLCPQRFQGNCTDSMRRVLSMLTNSDRVHQKNTRCQSRPQVPRGDRKLTACQVKLDRPSPSPRRCAASANWHAPEASYRCPIFVLANRDVSEGPILAKLCCRTREPEHGLRLASQGNRDSRPLVGRARHRDHGVSEANVTRKTVML